MPARLALVLGHGAGGGVAAPDLVVVTETALTDGVTVALVEQPYRVAGRRFFLMAPGLDEAWIAVVGQPPKPVPRSGCGLELGLNARATCHRAPPWQGGDPGT